jgi:hypothetical protein
VPERLGHRGGRQLPRRRAAFHLAPSSPNL